MKKVAIGAFSDAQTPGVWCDGSWDPSVRVSSGFVLLGFAVDAAEVRANTYTI